MVTASENAALTRVEGEAPMGRMLRGNYWLPFARSESLTAGGAPQRVRLLGTERWASPTNFARTAGCHWRWPGWRTVRSNAFTTAGGSAPTDR
jgi:hypothetical protein